MNKFLMRATRFFFLTFAIMQPVFAQSAESGIELISSRQISVDQSNRPHVESYIAVDPRDAQHLLATSMVLIGGELHAYPYASFDGGKTWAVGRIIGDASILGPGALDPIVYITNSGVSYFSALAKVKGVSRSLIARSMDGGRTWPTTVILPNTDRQWLVVDPSSGAFGGRTYFTATGFNQSRDGVPGVGLFLARSEDGGLTFPLRTIVTHDRGGPNPNAPLDAIPFEPLITSRGLFVLTLQGRVSHETIEQAKRDSLNAWSLGLMTSDDGGDSFGPARYAPRPRFKTTGEARRRQRGTTAGGEPRTAIDTSRGRFANRVYFVASDYDLGIDRYVVRVWSTGDFGKTWRTAVASDGPRGDVANPAIAVNRDGIVAVTWNDRRDDPQGRCWRLYSAVSLDGGENFQPSQRLSQAPTCANEPRNWETSGSGFNSDQSGKYLAHVNATATIPARFPMGGDTQGLAADANGVFHAAWINGETGVMQMWYSSFRVASPLVARMRSQASSTANTSAADTSAPAGMEEVTREVRFVVTSTNLDFSKRTFTLTVEIENRSNRPLYGPFKAVMHHFLNADSNGLGLKSLAVANADSGGKVVGSSWIFEVSSGVLAPGARTKPRVLSFIFEGGVPEFPEGELAPGFLVYGSVKRP